MYGTIFYFVLMPVLFIGPFLAGSVAGRKAQTTPMKGFYVGVLSAAAGLVIWLYFLHNILHINFNGIMSEIFYLIFIAYSLLSMPVAGLGGFITSITTYPNSRVHFKDTAREYGYEEKTTGKDKPTVFVVCSHCTTANPETNNNCMNCGNML